MLLRHESEHRSLAVQDAVPSPHGVSAPVEPRPPEAPPVEPAVDPRLGMQAAQPCERGVVEVQRGEAHHVADRRYHARAGRAESPRDQRLDRSPTRPPSARDPTRDARGRARRRSSGASRPAAADWPASTPPTGFPSPSRSPVRAGTSPRSCTTRRRSSAPSSATRVANLESTSSPSSSSGAKSNSSCARSGRPERFARRSRTVARSAQPVPRSSGTCATMGSSSESRPASASRATTVATIDFVSEPAPKRLSAVTGAPVLTSATPENAKVSTPWRRRPTAAPGTRCAPACSRRRSASSRSFTRARLPAHHISAVAPARARATPPGRRARPARPSRWRG